jgi:hypothetical protein
MAYSDILNMTNEQERDQELWDILDHCKQAAAMYKRAGTEIMQIVELCIAEDGKSYKKESELTHAEMEGVLGLEDALKTHLNSL